MRWALEVRCSPASQHNSSLGKSERGESIIRLHQWAVNLSPGILDVKQKRTAWIFRDEWVNLLSGECDTGSIPSPSHRGCTEDWKGACMWSKRQPSLNWHKKTKSQADLRIKGRWRQRYMTRVLTTVSSYFNRLSHKVVCRYMTLFKKRNSLPQFWNEKHTLNTIYRLCNANIGCLLCIQCHSTDCGYWE